MIAHSIPAPTARPAPSDADWDRLARVLAAAVASAYANGWRPDATRHPAPQE